MKIPTIMKAFKLPIELYKAIDKAKGKQTYHGYVISILKKLHKIS